jgi:uncharacterized protein (TIGR02391 family)
MRWDDLQLLKVIDDLEQSGQYISNGLTLLEQAAQGQTIRQDQEATPFARELLLARDAGYLTWNDQSARQVGQTDPLANSHYWLQTIWEIHLTLAGRDRARGRIIQSPLPDPDEDDDRPITGMTLEEIARSIGDTYTASQLPRYLHDSGIPDNAFPPEVSGSKWSYLLEVFMELHDGGSAARRVLRNFIGSWLDGRHHAPPPPDVRKRITALLGQQGWHVRDGRLVIGAKTYDAAGALTPLGRDARIAALHADVRQAADRYVESGHMEVAIFEAFKAVNNRVKTMTGLDIDGSQLMGQVFSDTSPWIVFSDLSTQTGRDVQKGLRFLFMGAVQGIRNPDAHEQFRPLDQEEALEKLTFASMLMRRLDEATLVRVPDDPTAQDR